MTTPLEDFAERFAEGDDEALSFMVGVAVEELRERLDPADAEIIAQWLADMVAGADPFRVDRRGRRAGGRNAESGLDRPHADHDNVEIAYAVHRRILASEPKMRVYKRVGRAYGLSTAQVRRIYRDNMRAMPKRIIGQK